MAWRLNSFFGCGKLETGGVTIGAIQLTLALITIILSILAIIGGLILINDPKTSPHDISTTKTMITVMIVLVCASLVDCITSIFLLVGTKKKNHRYILVWLIVIFVTTLLYLLSNIIAFNIYSLINFAIMIYFYLCIYSLYVKIKEEGGTSGHYESIPSSA